MSRKATNQMAELYLILFLTNSTSGKDLQHHKHRGFGFKKKKVLLDREME